MPAQHASKCGWVACQTSWGFKVRRPAADLRVWDRSFEFVAGDPDKKNLWKQRSVTQRTDVWAETFRLTAAATPREGTDVTAITWGSGVVRCERAADLLREEGISVEVIDLRTILPWDVECVLQSVRKTGKAIVVHEAIMTGGFGGEIASRIASDAFEHLDGPVKRIGAKDSFVPYAPVLETFVLPSQDEVTAAIRELGKY